MNNTDIYHSLRQRFRIMRWTIPLGLVSAVVFYQLGPARWMQHTYGDEIHFAIEILFYATLGPLLSFWVINVFGRWLDEKEQVEREVGASERRLASITTASADAILMLDPAGYIESWNHGAELLFGYKAPEALGQPFYELLGGGEAAVIEYNWLAETVRKNEFVRGHETICMDIDDQQIVVDLTATQLTGEQGVPIGMSVILRDITNRKRREEEIRQLNESLNELVAERTRDLAEKVAQLDQANSELQHLDQTRSEFISLVSHQIRAPLTNMQGSVERMQTDCGKINTTCTRMFTILEQQIARLDHLVQNVLNAARVESGDLKIHTEPVSVYPLVQRVVEEVRARTSGRVIHVPAKPGLPLVFADPNWMAEVLANLLDNADKYSPPGEKVEIELRADQNEITVSVRDFGPGLPLNEIERVFEKFYRADSSDTQSSYGYGLGLYVCRILMEAQGGRIWAENHPEIGAVFSFALPAWRGEDD